MLAQGGGEGGLLPLWVMSPRAESVALAPCLRGEGGAVSSGGCETDEGSTRAEALSVSFPESFWFGFFKRSNELSSILILIRPAPRRGSWCGVVGTLWARASHLPYPSLL